MPSKNTILFSLFWKFMERIGTQSVQLIISIVLARLLAPEEFGLIALVMVIIVIADVFVQSGLGTALIRGKNTDDEDFSSVFWAGIFIAAVLYITIFAASPKIADFYGKPALTPVIRVLTLSLFLGAFGTVQNAYIARNMLFKKLFYRGMAASIPSGILGIVLAYLGFGVWALVFQQLANSFLSVLTLWFAVPWKPHFKISFVKLADLFSFGWKLLVSSLISNIYEKLRSIVIGKMFSAADLAFFDRGDHFPRMIVFNINSSISSVMLPALSSYQDDRPQMKRLMQRAIKTSSFLITPMMVGLAVIAKPLTLILLGEKWLPSVPFIQACCFTYAFYPIHTTNLSAINAVGRSDIFLKLEIIKSLYGLALLCGSYFYFKSPIGIAYGAMLSTVISSFVNSYPNKKFVHYTYIEQIKDILPSFLLSGVMACGMIILAQIQLNTYISLILQIILGVFIYFFTAKLFRLESLDYILKTIIDFRNKKK